MRKLWKRWKKINAKILDKETTLILTILYWTLVAPVAIFLRLSSNSLNIKFNKNTFWFEKDTENVNSKENLKRQY